MTSGEWSTLKITLALYPFGAGAVAVNIFFAALLFSWMGGPVASTIWSIGLGCVLGMPATWLFARHIRHLMDMADRGCDGEGAQDASGG